MKRKWPMGAVREIEKTAHRGDVWAYMLFSVSLTLFLTSAAYTSGRSYVARASYALGVLYQTAPANPVLLPLDRESGHGPVAPGDLGPLSAPVLSQAEADSIRPEQLARTIFISKLRVSAPILETASGLGALNTDLENGVVRWPASARAGGEGTMVLLGHSSAPLFSKGKYGSVFALLDKLESGDSIFIDGPQGMLTYRVADRLTINPKTYKEDFQNLKGENLVLVSCWPVGTRLKRIAVQAKRVL